MSGYAELQVTSNFSFLRGASHPEEMVITAAALGHAANHNMVQMDRSHQVDADHLLPEFRVGLEKVDGQIPARIVDQKINPGSAVL